MHSHNPATTLLKSQEETLPKWDNPVVLLSVLELLSSFLSPQTYCLIFWGMSEPHQSYTIRVPILIRNLWIVFCLSFSKIFSVLYSVKYKLLSCEEWKELTSIGNGSDPSNCISLFDVYCVSINIRDFSAIVFLHFICLELNAFRICRKARQRRCWNIATETHRGLFVCIQP